jgi:prepilin-type N-terminal cleavage/methylation domain-containing protein
MHSIRSTNKEKGFTVVELLVSMVVVVILVVGINSIYLTHLAQSHRVRNVILVNSFVENKVEALRSAGFLSISDGTIDISNELPSDLNAPKSASLQISSPESGLKSALVSVTYSDNGTPRTYSYQTYVGELGVGQY